MAKVITNIPTISKIEYLNTTDKEFRNPETIAVLSCYLEGDRFKSFEISSIDFETGIIESTTGDLFRAEQTESLRDIAAQLQKRTHDIGADIPSSEIPAEELRNIIIEGNVLTIDNPDNSQSFRIVNMYYDISSDSETNIIQSKIDEKQEKIEKLRENPEANSEQITELTEKTNLASANIAEEGDKSAKLFKGAGMTLVLQDESTGEYTIRHFNDLTYSDLSRMTGFESPNAENPDKELVSKLEEIRAEISKENTHHAHSFKDDPMEIRGFSSLSIKGDKITGIADGRRVSFDLADVEVSYSNRGLSLTHVSKDGAVDEYLVTGVARDCQAKSTETLFNTICDAKQVVSMSDVMTQDNRSRVMQEVPSLGITMESVWTPGAKAPQEIYTVAGQKMNGEELAYNVYASEANNFIALKVGNDTKIMSFNDSSITKTSETLASIERTDDGFVATTQTNGKQITLDYVDMGNGIAISNGTVFKFEEGPSFTPIGGGNVDTSQIYINDKTNEIEQLIQSHASSSNKLIQNWDIVTEGNTLYLARNNPVIEDGKVVGMEVERLREITALSLDENRGILRVKFDEGFAHLGTPSNVSSENSIYTRTSEDGKVSRVAMAEVIENSPKGISTVIEQMNNAINTEHQDYKIISNPQEFVLNTPHECFVVMDNKLYFKEGDTIYSKSETHSYDEVRGKIDIAFNAPSSQETALLERLATEDLYTTLKDFRDVTDIELISEKTVEKLKAGEDTFEDERIVVNTVGSYERELPDEGFDIPMQME